jgi:lipoprotein-anchoring transpeptidase ErfK/SrfK
LGDERETALRRGVAWQVALDAAGFSPGLVDGQPGPKTTLATREFQKANNLPVTGQLDTATTEALKVDPSGVFDRYTIEPRDMIEIGPCPTSWIAKSKLKYLGHEALENVLAEKFHCSIGLLRTLNPRRQLNSLSAGDTVIVPTVLTPAAQPKAAKLEVNLAEKTIRVVAASGKVVGLFHCSIAKHKEKLPSRDTQVAVVNPNPEYRFDPDMWPEVKERIPGPIMIPPGPRNPVGRCWIGLGLKGYGMHGTPNPELIGKTGSHGCFRLANWDAQRLSRLVAPGTPVKFAGRGGVSLASRP